MEQLPVQLLGGIVGGVPPLAVHPATSPVLGSIMVLPNGQPDEANTHL